MKTIAFALCLVSLSFATGVGAQQQAPPVEKAEHLTRAQLNHLKRTAHTPEQYHILAAYYKRRQLSYLKEAAEEKQEWVMRSQYGTQVGVKYPRPVDSARSLYEFYENSAEEMGALSSRYQQLAETTGSLSAHGTAAVRK
jgi:hypothetical protein